MSTPLVADDVSVVLGARAVLRSVNLAVQPGWTAIVGPNGAGKSTLLRALAGLQAVSSGRVLLQGRVLTEWAARERACRIAWLAQHGEAVGDLTVREVVALGRLPHLGLWGACTAHDEAVVQQAMRDAECSAWQDCRMHQLSGGERQRVLLARVLAVDAPIWLLDEPTVHLDAPHQVGLARLLQAQRGKAVVSVLHDVTLALQADRLAVVNDGAICAHAARDDPALHAALSKVFGGALRVECVAGEWVALPNYGSGNARP